MCLKVSIEKLQHAIIVLISVIGLFCHNVYVCH